LIVLLATDVEVWPGVRRPSEARFREDFRRCILGPTPRGDFGLPFQLKRLKERNLKGIFLVDAMFASVFGLAYLKEIVDLVRGEGQEVQLHIHTEWVEQAEGLLPGKRGRNIRDFSREDQGTIIRASLENMARCNVEGITAFRAGNFGANWDTLEALAAEGILFDTSYNIPYIGSTCDLRTDPPLVQPKRYDGIIEFPITFFDQGRGRYRHAQIGSCSFSELTCMMEQALARGWHSFQVLSHNFELMNRAKDRPDPIMVRRFDRFLDFLAAGRDRFPTAWFGDLEPGEVPTDIRSAPLRSHWMRTACRYGEQIARRLFG